MENSNETQTKGTLKLFEKLHGIQEQIDSFAKDKSTNNYKYVSGSTVLNTIRPMMNAAKLILKQEVLSIENTREDYTIGFGTDKERTKSEILSKVTMKFTWIDCESGERDENLFAANGMNDWDKGVGSALTYAERYFLLKYFHIPTDADDPDGLEKNGHAQTDNKKQSDNLVYDKNDLASCQDVDDMNRFIQDNWISKMSDNLRSDLWKKADLLGLKYNKDSKSFVKI